MIEKILLGSGILFWVILMVYLVVSNSGSQSRIVLALKRLFLGKNLKDSIDQFVEEFPDQVQKQTVSDLSYSIITRITRAITIPLLLTVAISIVPYYFLIQQNRLIEKQNHLFDSQNNLLEADRRSSLVFLMSNILDRVDDEIQAQSPRIEIDSYRLSPAIRSRIIALSRAFRPYRALQGDSLSSIVTSPERGQLFISVISNELDSLTQSILAEQCNFSYADVGQITVSNANLKKLNLAFSNLRGADFRGSDLEGASFAYSDFSEPDKKTPYVISMDEARGANFYGCNLAMADFEGAKLGSSDFSRTDLFGTRFSSAEMREAYFDFSELRWTKFDSTDLRNASFRGCSFHAATFVGANLEGVDLSHASLSTFEMAVNGEDSDLTELTFDQLLSTRSLYNTKNLSEDLRRKLAKVKPCLFTKEGCLSE